MAKNIPIKTRIFNSNIEDKIGWVTYHFHKIRINKKNRKRLFHLFKVYRNWDIRLQTPYERNSHFRNNYSQDSFWTYLYSHHINKR